MKKIFILLLAVQAWGLVVCQSPEAMSFQAVIRDANSALVQNTQVGIQISVLQGSVNGLASYIERHFPTTNDNGLATLEIGNGAAITGNFASIDWSNGPYFLKTETDLNGGTSYTISGTSQLLSVPYALHAATAESANETDPVFGASVAGGITGADTANWNNDLVDDADADPGNEIQTLSHNNDTLSISGGNFVLLPQDQDWSKSGNAVFNVNDSIGIGTSTPLTNLDVAGGFRFDDGNQMEGRVLVSDSLGFARWDTLMNPETFSVTNPSWGVAGPGYGDNIYCSVTLTLTKKSLVFTNANGHAHINTVSNVIAGIVYPGETLHTTAPRVFNDLKDAVLGGAYTNMAYPMSTSRVKILPPGTHTISLRFGSFLGNTSGTVSFSGGSLTGYVIPFN